MWVAGTKLWSFAQAASTLEPRISLQPQMIHKFLSQHRSYLLTYRLTNEVFFNTFSSSVCVSNQVPVLLLTLGHFSYLSCWQMACCWQHIRNQETRLNTWFSYPCPQGLVIMPKAFIPLKTMHFCLHSHPQPTLLLDDFTCFLTGRGRAEKEADSYSSPRWP